MGAVLAMSEQAQMRCQRPRAQPSVAATSRQAEESPGASGVAAGRYNCCAPATLAKPVRRHFLSFLFPTACLVAGLAGQEPVEPAPPPSPAEATAAPAPDRAARAIADYEAVRGDKEKAAQERRALIWLGEVDSPEVTDYLLQELKRVAGSTAALGVVEAIGKVARPAAQAELTALLHGKRTIPALRTAAAGVLLRLGDRAMDEILQLAGDAGATPAARDAAVQALVASGLDRAWRGLVPVLLAADEARRLELLRRCDAVRACVPFDNARVDFVRKATLPVAACAFRQLAAAGHARAKDLTVDLLERLLEDPPAAVAVDLVGGLPFIRDADFYPALLRFGAIAGAPVQRALRAAAPVVAKDPALLEYLITKGLDDERPAVREASRLLLSEAPAEAVRPLVERVRAELRAKKKKALDAAEGLHEILARDPSWRADLAGLAASNDLERRLLGLALLLEIDAPSGIGPAQQSLGSKQWELRSLCYRYLTRCRDVTSIPFLIARVGKEEGRLQQELDAALFAHTGTRCWSKKEWEKWWSGKQQGFVLPNAATIQSGGGSGGGNTIAYHDIPVVSARLCFLVDRSGSMSATVGTDKKFTRLDAAKEQLTAVVSALPAEVRCNLIVYETDIFQLWKELRPLQDDHKKDMLQAIKRIPLGGGTNIFDALETAYQDPDVDTIYLLTDGQPSAGRLRDPEAILDEVRHWHRRRQIIVHCIAIGLDSDLLRRLAALTGGSYKQVK